MAVEKEILVLVCLTILFIALFYGIYQIFFLLKVYEKLKRQWEKSEKQLEKKRERRKDLEKEIEALYGEMEKKTFMAKIDCSLAYSGLSTRFPTLTAEKFVQKSLLVVCAELVVIWFLFQNLSIAVLVSCISTFIMWETLLLLRTVRSKRINREVLHFIDYMEINATVSNDVIEIIRITALKVKEPLKTELFTTVFDAKHSGNKSEALRRLCNRIEHKYMKDLILNLDTCSRGKENYKEVLKEAKKIFLQDLANQEKIKKMYQNTFLFTLGLGIGGWLMLQLLSSNFINGEDVFAFLWRSGTVGKGIVLYGISVLAISLWHAGKKAYM